MAQQIAGHKGFRRSIVHTHTLACAKSISELATAWRHSILSMSLSQTSMPVNKCLS